MRKKVAKTWRAIQAGRRFSESGFLFHLGDVIYGPGKERHYGERFYRHIVTTPGNYRDPRQSRRRGKSAADKPSLNAFQANFCAKVRPCHTAAGSGIYREL